MKDRLKFKLSADQAEETASGARKIIDDGCALLTLKAIQKNPTNGGFMERIDLTKVIKDATAIFCQNRIGDKPPISVTIPAMVTDIPWPDRKLQELVKLFLYETLLTNDPDAEVTVSLRRRSELKDLSEFVGVQPSYWLHLRISGRGVRLSESFIDEFFADIGYKCAEWVGVAESETRLGIFTAADMPDIKIVFCLDDGRFTRKFDLLLPVREPVALSCDVRTKH